MKRKGQGRDNRQTMNETVNQTGEEPSDWQLVFLQGTQREGETEGDRDRLHRNTVSHRLMRFFFLSLLPSSSCWSRKRYNWTPWKIKYISCSKLSRSVCLVTTHDTRKKCIKSVPKGMIPVLLWKNLPFISLILFSLFWLFLFLLNYCNIHSPLSVWPSRESRIP